MLEQLKKWSRKKMAVWKTEYLDIGSGNTVANETTWEYICKPKLSTSTKLPHSEMYIQVNLNVM